MIKRIISIVIVGAVVGLHASAFDLNSVLKGIGTTDSTSTGTTGSGGGLGDLLGGVAGALGLGNSKADVASLAGEWSYTAPAVSFKSDNLLKKAGGAAAASAVESKLEPYYKKAGFDKLVVTIGNDSTFTFKLSKVTLSGTITPDAEAGTYTFNFKALGKVSVASMEGYITLSGSNNMSLTFDVSRLIKLIEMAGSITGNSTIKGVSALLNQYDGLTAGFDLTRTASAK